MKKRMICLVLCTSILSGCNKINMVDVLKATSNATTYDYTELEKETLKGSLTLEPGLYLVVSNEGSNCVISDGQTKEMFSEREYINVSQETKVTITNGYLMKEENAPALNGLNYNKGVYLIGKDITPKVYSNKGSWVAYNETTQQYETVDIKYLETVPELFSIPTPNSLSQSSKIEFTDGMLVLLTKSYMEESAIWDVENAVQIFFDNYKDTSVDSLRQEYGIVQTVDNNNTQKPLGNKTTFTGETKSFSTKSGNKYLLKAGDIEKESSYFISNTQIIMPLNRMWVESGTDLSGTLSNISIYKKSDVSVKIDLSKTKLGKYSQYLGGIDFKLGTYKLSGGSVNVSKTYSEMTYSSLKGSTNYVTYSDGDIITLSDEDIITTSDSEVSLILQE